MKMNDTFVQVSEALSKEDSQIAGDDFYATAFCPETEDYSAFALIMLLIALCSYVNRGQIENVLGATI